LWKPRRALSISAASPSASDSATLQQHAEAIAEVAAAAENVASVRR